MDTNKADILQIRKYLEGKLDARAMHELERRALDDPFLMDALEGYENAGNQDKAAGQLHAELQKRLQKPEAKVFSLSRLAIAASVITVLGAGVWLFSSRQPVNQEKAELTGTAPDKTMVAPSPQLNEPEIAINKDSLIAANVPKTVLRSSRRKRVYREPTALNDVDASADETAELASSIVYHNGSMEEVMSRKIQQKTDSVPLNEMLVMGIASQRKKATAATVQGVPTPGTTKEIKGKVINAMDGEPLPGVNVKAGDANNVAVTGADGSYTLKLDSVNTNITYNYIGFRSKKLDVGAATNTVALEPESASLNEVVITNYGNAKKVSPPYPAIGLASFEKYLADNAVGDKAYTVKVTFTVNPDGSLSNFKTNKPESDQLAKKAIQLIKDASEWVGNPKKAESKSVTVKFRKADN